MLARIQALEPVDGDTEPLDLRTADGPEHTTWRREDIYRDDDR